MKSNSIDIDLRQSDFNKKEHSSLIYKVSVVVKFGNIFFLQIESHFNSKILRNNLIKFRHWIQKGAFSFVIYLLCFGFNTRITSQVPVVTARFANPAYNCANEYCVDVEFRSDTPGVQIFGVNVRFFYPDSILEFIGFSDFQGGYGPVAPDPPIILTSAFAGTTLFNFNGPADFVNGAVQLVDPGIVTYLDTATWTKLFQICFHIDDPNPNLQSFCPSLVWDLEQFPSNGEFRQGYLLGDDGVVITLVDAMNNNESIETTEDVVQFNWMYI
ncbi:MAG: hypothetical protein ABJB16_00955, partial [Saprospiraceae bacterium]